MTYLSVCSGIEAVTVAWEPLGFKPVGFAEIEPFPCKLLKQKYPDVKNYGDITKYKEWDCGGKFDILVGGTPCQSFSIAGKRGGTDDIRGKLMYSYLDIVGEYKPQWIIWENVPGVLSSGKGLDFASFLSGLEKCGYGWAYRVLDAQYFGVPQRRRRVFVIGHSADRADLAAKVLFEPKSVCRDITAGKEQKQETSERIGESTESTYFRRGGSSKYHEDTRAATLRNTASPDYFDLVLASEKPFRGDVFAINGRQDPCVTAKAGAVDTFSHTNCIGYVGSKQQKIRRLTPLECERLQGFPDNYTQIEWRGKPKDQCPDSHRYKAIGNSMAVPVMRWIGKRIKRMAGENTMKQNLNEKMQKRRIYKKCH
ncbi:DNA cytosine methyltransferase [Treponema pedis]|uniref:DNA cytosine methyltransferase n=1 Tax=Treponema pedis TaxID=409322 RepID=UPI0004025C1F|nr:DNA (cytosine-5-)-methyltransferase [Treponema pedis]